MDNPDENEDSDEGDEAVTEITTSTVISGTAIAGTAVASTAATNVAAPISQLSKTCFPTAPIEDLFPKQSPSRQQISTAV